jgi:hypothetical protein
MYFEVIYGVFEVFLMYFGLSMLFMACDTYKKHIKNTTTL